MDNNGCNFQKNAPNRTFANPVCVKHVISRETAKIPKKFSNSIDLRPSDKLNHLPSCSFQANGTNFSLPFVVCVSTYQYVLGVFYGNVAESASGICILLNPVAERVKVVVVNP